MKSMVAKVVALRKLEEVERQLQDLEMNMLEKTSEHADQSLTQLKTKMDRLDESMSELTGCMEVLNVKPLIKKELRPQKAVSFNPSF